MSTPQNCINCRWWQQTEGTAQGACRRNPPIVVAYVPVPRIDGQVVPTAMFGWPEAKADQGCGEWAELSSRVVMQ